MNYSADEYQNAIAIIGISGRFPKASDVKALWENLLNGVESVDFYTDAELSAKGVADGLLKNPDYVKAGIELEDKFCFDAKFFGLSSKEALITDPQQRLLLESSFHVLEQAGYKPQQTGLDVGVFVGVDPSSYFIEYVLSNTKLRHLTDPVQLIYSNHGAATQISYHLNLKGPSLNINTACSTSLVAVHQACRSLLMYESKMAIAGGASIYAKPQRGYLYKNASVYAVDGHCRAFDQKATGTVAGQGVGVVLLKRLEDAIADDDNVYAIIRGSAINNDAQSKISYTAPSVEGQLNVIKKALSVADIAASDIGYIECHGTGTSLGDTIELTVLNEIYGQGRSNSDKCILGSIKPNIGHLNSAAGIASLIKTTKILNTRTIPPMINFEKFNQKHDLDYEKFHINKEIYDWKVEPENSRVAAISSFGIGGTNAHLIVEEYVNSHKQYFTSKSELHSLPVILTVSAKSKDALIAKIKDLYEFVTNDPNTDLYSLAYTLNCCKVAYGYRIAFVVQNIEDAVRQLANSIHTKIKGYNQQNSRLMMLFSSDLSSDIVNKMKALYKVNDTFREGVDKCNMIIKNLYDLDIVTMLYDTNDSSDKSAQSTGIQQKIILMKFAFQYALASWYQYIGVQVDCIYGYYLGEYVAACVAGVLSLNDALSLVYLHSKNIMKVDDGMMLECHLSRNQLTSYVGNEGKIAAKIKENVYIIYSSKKMMLEIIKKFDKDGIYYQQLAKPFAFYSGYFETTDPGLEKLVSQINIGSANTDFYPSLQDKFDSKHDIASQTYWQKQLYSSPSFSSLIDLIIEHPTLTVLDIAEQTSTLCQLIKRNVFGQSIDIINACSSDLIGESYTVDLLTSLAHLWEAGHDVNFDKLAPHNIYRKKICLPVYPFDKSVFKLEDKNANTIHKDKVELEVLQGTRDFNDNDYALPENDLQKEIVTIWQETIGDVKIGIRDNFFRLGGHSLIAIQILSRIKELFNIEIAIDDFMDNPTVEGLVEIMLYRQMQEMEKEML